MTHEDGIVAISREVNGFTLSELRFPPSYVQVAFDPELPYLALVLDGSLEKSFRRRTMRLDRACGVAMPAGAWHGARFGAEGARIAIVQPRDASGPAAHCLDRLVELRGHSLSWLAWRLAGELRASDTAAPLAAEGFALELLAATSRELRVERRSGRPQPWLRSAEELLRVRIGDHIGLTELAEAVGVHPAHLARASRAQYGLSVGEYGRRVRLMVAAKELAGGDTSVATIAAQAGFADQSHFTRVFKRYVGVTPARYRAETQRDARHVPE
ncbi:MAG TPA: helix-turn-helix transcriptional regulator [Gaiellaceae bacterium]|nr:helix-turn-helix transcriptional regulator [Gaiellaceae bacterium]